MAWSTVPKRVTWRRRRPGSVDCCSCCCSMERGEIDDALGQVQSGTDVEEEVDRGDDDAQ